MNRRRSLLLLAGLAILSFAWSCSEAPGASVPATPAGSVSTLPVTTQMAATAAPAVSPQPPAILERRFLTLEYPPAIRSGDSDVIRLTLDVDRTGYVTPTALYEGHATTGQPVEFPDLYDTYNVLVFARLDMAGVAMQPNGEAVTALARGQSVYFTWSVAPLAAGTFRGTAWVGLRFVPKEGGEMSERMLAALPLETRTSTLFGLNGSDARIAGTVGTFLGTVLGFPFLEDILRWLWKRMKKSG
jgi:hypothetical protein